MAHLKQTKAQTVIHDGGGVMILDCLQPQDLNIKQG